MSRIIQSGIFGEYIFSDHIVNTYLNIVNLVSSYLIICNYIETCMQHLPFTLMVYFLLTRQESLYNITVVVEDLLIILRERLPVVVAYLPCKAPEVWVQNSVSTPLDAPTVMRSRPFRVTGEAKVECNGTVATR